jgi:hypothetical protein
MIRSFFASVLAVIVALLPAFAGNDAQTYPLLKDGPSSASYVLEQVDDYWSPANITYSPAGNFFVLESLVIKKINGRGEKVFSLKRGEQFNLLPFTHYVATPKGLYDLSKSRPKLERFVQVVNGDKTRTLTQESFHEIYAQAYADADIVVYDVPNFEEGIDKYRAYMWITGDWVLFYLSDRAITLDMDYEMGVTVAEYPAKFNRTVLLKDMQTRSYSSASSDLREVTPRLKALLAESRMRYPARGKLKVMHYRNQRVDETHRGVAVVHTGMASHRLRVGGEDLYFREIAVKVRSSKLQTQLLWFVPPAPYQNKTQVGFLEFMPGSNLSTAGSGGVYVLRRK